MKKILLLAAALASIFSAGGVVAADNGQQVGPAGWEAVGRKYNKPRPQQKVKEISAVDSPYEACKDVAIIDGDDYAKRKDYWDQVVRECGANGELQVMSSAGFVFKEIYAKTQSLGFLQEVGKRAEDALTTNIAKMEQVAACFHSEGVAIDASLNRKLKASKAYNAKPSDRECSQLRDNIKELVKKVQPEARQALALAGGSGPYVNSPVDPTSGIAMGEDQFVVPYEHELVAKKIGDAVSSSILPENMEELTSKERKTAEKEAAKYATEIEKAVSEGKISLYDAAGQFQQFKLANKMKYMAALQEAPVLAYLGTTKVDGKEGDQAILKAVYQLIENGYAERERVANVMKAGHMNYDMHDAIGNVHKADRSTKALTDFMMYTPVIEDILKKDPKLCAVATGLSKQVDKSNLGKNIALGAGMITAGVTAAVLFPPSAAMWGLGGGTVAAIAMGPPLGLSMVASSYMDLKHAKEGAWNRVGIAGEKSSIRKTEDVEEARSSLNWSVALEPLDWLGTGAGGFAGRFMVNAAAKRALVSGGLAKEEAARLINLTTSDVKSVSKDAQAEVKKAAGSYMRKLVGIRSEEEMKQIDGLVQTMADKGFAGTPAKPNSKYVEEMLATIGRLEARGPKFVENATKIFQEINPAKFNDFTRARTEKAVIAMANFGVDNAKSAAGKLNEWDQGIESLTKSYELATKKMQSRELASIANLEERQAKAYDSALDDLMKNSPEFKAMSVAEREAAKKEMKTCGLK